MPGKAQMYAEVATETAGRISGSFERWTGFLETAARLYKYPFHEQLMIYAQRPEATACASFETWNETMRRYVKRGSKGIALIDPETERLRYVFDVSDTGTRENSRRLYLWEFNENEHFDAVSKALEQKYDVSDNNGISEQLEVIAAQLVDEFWNAHQRDILSSVEDSFLSDYDDFDVNVSFHNAATVSTTYMLLSRCGLDPQEYFSPEDYLSVFDFNTPEAVYALGSAISETSEEILRTVETAVKNYEREKRAERIEHHEHNIQHERGLSDSRSDGRTPDSSRQVRQNENELSQNPPPDPLEQDDTSRQAERASSGDRQLGEQPVGDNDNRNDERSGSDREAESRESVRVDGNNEQPEVAGRGDNSERDDLRLDEPSWEQVSLFPTEEEQIAEIDSFDISIPAAFSFSEDEINSVLIHGGSEGNARLRVVAEFEKQKPLSEIAEFLSDNYKGAAGFKSEQGDFSAKFDSEGIHLSRGRSVEKAAQTITWETAAERIETLLQDGRFASNVELAEAAHYEKERTAESLWFMVRDLADEYKDIYFQTVREGKTGNFPDNVAQIVSDFDNPDYIRTVLSEIQTFRQDYAVNRDILRFHHYNQDKIERAVSDLLLPRTEFQTVIAEVEPYRGFITDDEINNALKRPPVSSGDIRIYEFFKGDHTDKEKAAFLKNEYGTGGRYPGWEAYSSGFDYSSKGICLKKGGCYDVQLPWTKVAKYVDRLVSKDEYLTPERQAEYDRRHLATEQSEPSAPPFYTDYTLIREQHPDDIILYQIGDFFEMYGEDAEKAAEMLGLHLAHRNFGNERVPMCGIPSFRLDDYVEELRGKYDVTISSVTEGAQREVSRRISVDHEAEIAIDRGEAEFGADGWRATDGISPERESYSFMVAEEYNALQAAHPEDIILYQEDGFFEIYADSAEKASQILEFPRGTASFGDRRVRNLSVPANELEENVEKLRESFGVTISAVGENGERSSYSLGKTEVEREQATPRKAKFEQSDIDELLIAWNGSPESKRAVYEYMLEHERERDTAAWLAREYGANPSQPLSLNSPAVEEELKMPWAKVQRRIAQLIHSGDFMPEAEREQAEVEQAEQPAETAENPLQAHYNVGDTVYLDNTAFEITEIGLFDVQLLDPTLAYPVLRVESKERLEILLQNDERNAHLFAEQEQEQPTPDYTSETVALYPAESNHLPFDVVVETLHFDEPEHTPPTPAAENFRITDDHLGEGGAKAKFRMNMEAINLLKELEFDGRQATPDEQAILSRYVGWGGLADAFDESKSNWANEFQELYAALTPEEYAAARASTLNAHYTSPTVIKAIYEAVGNMGFETGNILEPSMGVGNFFGLLPESMQSSKLYGVELDSLTGRIAKQLYPKADIKVAGFETTDRRDFFDLAVGNVPFGNYKVNDRAYNKLGFSIHDNFIAKTLDQVRAGGVIAFVTSRYTMDKQSPEVRKYIAERAELLGAIRLPNNAFKANAGTEVTSDIIFLQKRDRPIAIDEDWIHLGQTSDGFAVNSYFVDHPEMVLGTLTAESTQYGKEDLTVNPIEGANLAEQLHEAIQHIGGIYREAELPDLGEDEKVTETIPADPSVRNYSYAIVDGEVYFRENSVMVKPDLNATAKERIKGLAQLRDCVHKLIDEQTDGYSDSEIKSTQQELNRIYDRFTAKFGLINTRPNQAAFSQYSAYYLLCSLEILDENKNLARKADIFTKKTIKPHEVVTSVDTAAEALALSVSEKACVDMSYMSELTGKDVKTLASDLRGVIFKDYAQDFSGKYTYRTADDFLSGNVRQKLKYYESIADSTEGDKHQAVLDNIEALKAAQPKDLDASEIEVRLGATWIDKEYIRQFMFDTFEPPYYLRYKVEVNFSDVTAEWSISNKSAVADRNFSASMNYGTGRLNPYKILEDTLNLRDVRVYDTVKDTNGNDKRVLNEKETTLAQQKQQAIKDAFRDWIWKNPERREKLVTKYNELFNSTRPREYDGSHIKFVGMNPEINLRDHQKNAIAHVLYGGNTLLAHEVGAGKTFEMAAAAMESKRLGLCRKSLFVVPNHLTEQWASEFLRLYPSANILAATKRDFEPQNRKKFCARIATGDYDAIIIGHSQFEKIPVSAERQERLLREQIAEITDGIAELKYSNAERFNIKQLEKTKKSLEARLEKLQATNRKDDVVTFEQLGVDRLFVDEAHSYKNLFLYSKMRNVAGLSTTDAQKSSDMFMKCRYLDEITDSKGVIFATGTPVSNSMTELYTMQRYLQYDLLKQLNMTHFDCWASTFGETTTALELAPEGTGYRARTRFAKFFNLPELMNIFKETADIKTADQLHLPTPEAVFHNVVAQPTEIQKEMVKELSQRAAAVHSGKVDSSVDNMLKITSDGRKLGLDQRIINPNLPDESQSKVNQCVDNIFKIWEDGKDDKLTQLVFCDLSTPKNTVAEKTAAKSIDSPELNALLRLTEDDGGEKAFSVYDDIRAKLTAKGIPKEEIAFIHEANTEVKKKELFSKVRSGQVRVLMGSTFKMGAGTNVQDRLAALHDLDAPWRPGDLEQRLGRIVRQGNRNSTVQIFRYMTEATFDAYLWQTLENKQKFISQIMTSKSPVRSADDLDETALSYAEIKALCAGDPRIKEKMDLDVDVARLKLLKANHQSQQYKLEDNLLKHFPEKAEHLKSCIKGFEKDIQTVSEHPHPHDGFAGMTVRGDTLTDKENAGAALLDSLKGVKGLEPVKIGSYRGFEMFLSLENFGQTYSLTLKGEMSHKVELGNDARGNLTRIDNVLNNIPNRLKSAENELENINKQMESAKSELGKPFPQEEELREKRARLIELNAELNINDKQSAERTDDSVAAKEKPSIIQRLKQPAVSEKPAGKVKNIGMEER